MKFIENFAKAYALGQPLEGYNVQIYGIKAVYM